MRSFFNLVVVLCVYLVGISANTGDKKNQSQASESQFVVLSDNRVVFKRAEDTKPLRQGQIPDLVFKDSKSQQVKIRDLVQKAPIVMIVYRGGWCPYCNRQLADLQKVIEQIKGKGYQVLAVSADRPEKIKEVLGKKKFDYQLLSDSSMSAAIDLGIAFQVPKGLVKTYKDKYSIDLEDASGEKHHFLPVPSVYVVDSSGEIKFVHSNPDYKVRLSNEDLLKAL